MQRLCVDQAEASVKRFFANLPLGNGMLELEMEGQVVCRVLPADRFSGAEAKSLIEERWRLIRKAQDRNRGVSARAIEREVASAVDAVRSKLR